MTFTITAQGRVIDPSIQTSSGNADLDAAALSCASTWTYKPAAKNGVAVETPWTAAVQWKLSDVREYQLVAVCDRYHPLSAQMLSAIGGVTGLTLRVMPDGRGPSGHRRALERRSRAGRRGRALPGRSALRPGGR